MAYEVMYPDGHDEIHSDDYAKIHAADWGDRSVSEVNRMVDNHEDFNTGNIRYEWCDEDHVWKDEIGEDECTVSNKYVVIDGKTETLPDCVVVTRGVLVEKKKGQMFGTFVRHGVIVS